jgi:hypothetical protein
MSEDLRAFAMLGSGQRFRVLQRMGWGDMYGAFPPHELPRAVWDRVVAQGQTATFKWALDEVLR